MALELRDCTFNGPALPEPFVKFQLERELSKRNLLAKTTGAEGRALEDRWEVLRRKLRQLGEQGGDRRVANHVLEPLVERLGYSALERQAEVITREGAEDGGWLFTTPEGQRLRAWTVSLGTDLDAPNRRGRAYRFSPSRVAQRVLLASGERMGLLSDGEELRILLCDPARPDSHISIRLDRAGGWRAARALPDSYRLLLALASPAGVAALPDLTEAARLAQSSVTKKLRLQARRAIEGFLQEVLEHPANAQALADRSDRQQLAQQLWGEGLITVYRLLFVFKLESSADPARAFSFAATSLWRNTYSPNTALADLVRRVLDEGKESGGFLEAGLRTLWRLFAEGMSSSELEIKPLGGMLFGRNATPLLDQLQWGEQAVARLLDALLWTPGEGVSMRERVHYGALDVEDLGRVYESLLELEPGISSEPMCRLRRAKLEVVVPVAQGDPYRSNPAQTSDPEETAEDEEEGDEDEPAPTRGRAASGSKTKVEFIEEIAADRFFLRVGLGRKASGSYYTPHPFVRFLVQETLGVLLAECSPRDNPQPALILKLKVLDAAMGSGHFLVEACRFLGEGLYEACRLCDELAVQAEEQAEKTEGAERETLLAKAAELRQRVADLPDPNNELLAYLPSRASEGEESGLSQKKAEAMCRRLVAVHCLYGVDKNPLAVELAKLSLWLESYAEGLPLTFLDHRLICGDSLIGPFFEHLLTYPKSGGRLDDLFTQGLTKCLEDTLASALAHVQDLEASVGKDLADLSQKETAKKKLDDALAPLKTLAAGWSGGLISGEDWNDREYQKLAIAVARNDDMEEFLGTNPALARMVEAGSTSICFDLTWPEVFFANEDRCHAGFSAVLGNPPWEGLDKSEKEFYGAFDLAIYEANSKKEQDALKAALSSRPDVLRFKEEYDINISSLRNATRRMYLHVNIGSAGASAATPDMYQCFSERSGRLTNQPGKIGIVLPSAFHSTDSACGLRKLYLDELNMGLCFSYENKRGYFDIHRSKKYDLIVAGPKARATHIQSAFYLHDYEWLFAEDKQDRLIVYTPETIDSTTGKHLNLLEFRSPSDANVASRMYINSDGNFGRLRTLLNILPTEELHTSKQRHRALPLIDLAPWVQGHDPRSADALKKLASEGVFLTCKGEDFHQYDDKWGNPPSRGTTTALMEGKELRLKASCYYRLVFRRQASSTNERTVIANIAPPGWLFFDSALPEKDPYNRPSFHALLILSLCNSYCFDWLVRLMVAENITFNYLDSIPVPALREASSILVHLVAIIFSNEGSYQDLVREQLFLVEPRVLPEPVDHDSRRDIVRIRALIDAVVASCYGLRRADLEHILNGFSHRASPEAPFACLEAFDELKEIGLAAFSRRHDPYCDIPLNENLPRPVIELETLGNGGTSLGPLFVDETYEVKPMVSTQPPVRAALSTASLPNLHRVSATPFPSANGAFTTIAELLRSRGVITSSDAQQATGLDAAGVRPHLQQLVQQGLAVTEGQRRGMRYRRVDG